MPMFKTWTDAIGHTPLVSLRRLDRDLPGKVAVKLEYTNPLGSLKDRIALAMVEQAEQSGRLRPGMTVVEATNGNTGIAIAAVCVSRGYPVVIVMPETMSMERRIMLRLLGAEVRLTPAAFGLVGSFAVVAELVASNPSYYFINQGENEANPAAHHQTAAEIWEDTAGEVGVVVSGVGTGGSFRGIAEFLKQKDPRIRMIAVEPEESPVLSGGERGVHRIPGIGPGIIPPMLDACWPDGIERVSSEEARQVTRRVIAEEGIPVGISSGAMIAAALRVASRPENRGTLVVTLAASQVERYLSTHLAEEERRYAEGLSVSEPKPELLQQAMAQKFETRSRSR